jgi:hypothetical protein
MTPTKLGGLSLALAGGALALATLPARPTDAALSKDKRLAIMKAVPLLVTLVQKEGKILGIAAFGSGTTVTARGHILTANHVISFHHALPEGITVVPDMYVFLTPENNADPVPICTFNPGHMPHDAELDIAMVMCEHDLKGNPWDPASMRWPTVTLGDPASMTQGDDIWIFGYPGAGQDPRKKSSDTFLLPTMNVSAGKFTGVINEQDTPTAHHISWVKTDAEISGGNSGGCTTDDEGNYLGSPNEVHTDVRDTHNGDGGTVGHVGFIRPTNLFKPYADLAAKGWVPGASASDADTPAAPSGEGVVVTGRIASADTEEPVAGMVVVVFKPGVTAKQVMAAKTPADLMLTRGQSGPDGEFTMASKVPKGKYTVAVIGQGYKLVLEEHALIIDDDTPATYRAWNRIAVSRCKSGADCIQ